MEKEQLKLGKAFKELRTKVGMTGNDFKGIMSRESLVKFEADRNVLGLEKLSAALKLMGFSIGDLFYMAKPFGVERYYGTTFHAIRFQRGYRRDFFTSIGVSDARLDLFEEGRIMLPYSTIDAMLGSMNVPESDFEYALNDEDNFFIQSVDKMDMAIREKNFEYLQSVERSAKKYSALMSEKSTDEEFEDDPTSPDLYTDEQLDYFADEYQITRQYADYRVLELTAKSGYCELSEDELTEVGDFLEGVDIFLEYSLGVLAIMSWQLPYITVRSILSDLVAEGKRYKDKLVYRRRILQAAGRCAMSRIVRGELKEAQYLLSLVHSFTFTVDTHTQGMYRFAQEFLNYKKGDLEAQNRMLKVIDTFDFLGENSSYKFAKDYYNRYVLGKVV